MRTWLSTVIILLSSFFILPVSAQENFRSLLRPNGKVMLARYVYGDKEQSDLSPAYRADLVVYMDIFRYKNVIFNFMTKKTTSIGKDSDSPIKMDAIRYSLAPGIRYVRKKTILTLELLHECIHTISREEEKGSVYWNILRLGFGTKGAYHYYLADKYISNDITLRNSWDAAVELGYYFRGDFSEWVGQNHDYTYDLNGIARYHFEPFKRKNMFLEFRGLFLYEDSSQNYSQFFISLNYILRASRNIALIYFQHCLHDDNPHDNFDRLGSVGLKFVF